MKEYYLCLLSPPACSPRSVIFHHTFTTSPCRYDDLELHCLEYSARISDGWEAISRLPAEIVHEQTTFSRNAQYHVRAHYYAYAQF